MDTKLDAFDRKLLYSLEIDGRQPLSKVARSVGMSKQAARYRVDSLVKRGIIKLFLTQINIAKLGYTNFEVWIRLKDMDEEKRQAMFKSLVDHPHIVWVATCAGKWDLVVSILARSVAHFDRLYLELLLNPFSDCIRSTDISIVSENYNFRRAYLIGGRRDPEEFAYSGGEPSTAAFTGMNLRILREIAFDARLPVKTIAERIGASPLTVSRRIRELVKSGVISRFKAFICSKKVGFEQWEVLLTLQNLTPKREKELFGFCANNPNVIFLIKCVGRWGLDIAIDVKNVEEFNEFVNQLRAHFPDILRDFETVRILQDYKMNYLPPPEKT